MATVYYGVDRGGHDEDVAIGTSTPGKNVELVVNEGVVLSRQDLFDALQAIENAIVKNSYSAPTGGIPTLDSFSLSNPLYIAHRGAGMRYPENTTEGLAASFSAGNRALEMDVRVLTDGGLGMMHDGTVDRTTTGTGAVNTFDTPGYLALKVDADSWFGTTVYGNTITPPLFPDIARAYVNSCILVPEAKTGSNCGQALCNALTAAGWRKDRVLVQTFDLTDAGVILANGYHVCYLTDTDTDIAAAQTAGIEWVGVSNGAAATVFQNWVAAGIKTLVYVPTRRYRRDALFGYGVMGLFTDDPQYVSANAPLATQDNFAAQTWMPGMIAIADAIDTDSRGTFEAPDWWGWTTTTAALRSCMMGWAGPLKGSTAPTDATIELSVRFDSANAADQTRYASAMFSKDDESFLDGVAANVNQQGFLFLMRKNGDMNILKRSTSASSQVTFAHSVDIADGEEVRYRIKFTATGVSISRLDGSGNAAYTATWADTDPAFRGGYMHLSRAGLACRFRHITVA